MAKVRGGGAVRSKINMILFGDPYTGKSTMALQLMYMKNPDGSPFKVLYIDPETGSIDDYIPKLSKDGINVENNLYITYSQSLSEVREFIRRAKDGDDFFVPDEDGEETDEVWVDSEGKPFRPDAIVVDGATVLNLTTKQGIIEMSKKRAKVKADAAGIIGDERYVKIESAGLELKDYQTVNFKGQDLILDLNATGKHYIVTARETDEKEPIKVGGKVESVCTGNKIPDGFKGMEHNCKTSIRMYRPKDDYETVHAYVKKDRTGVHNAGEDIEDPSLLDWQDIITRTANNKDLAIKNNLQDAVSIEEHEVAKDLGIANEAIPAPEISTKSQSMIDEISVILKSLDPIKKNAARNAIAESGFSGNYKKISDEASLAKYLEIMKSFKK